MNRKQKKYRVEYWMRTDKYLDYVDLLSVLFDSQDMVTEKELDKALKIHLEREV